jgi:hypothetical protein
MAAAVTRSKSGAERAEGREYARSLEPSRSLI